MCDVQPVVSSYAVTFVSTTNTVVKLLSYSTAETNITDLTMCQGMISIGRTRLDTCIYTCTCIVCVIYVVFMSA